MAYGRIPYAPTQVYQPGDRIAELLQRRGEIQAEGALRSGDIWGNTIAGLGQAAGQYIGQRQEESKLKKRDAAWLSFVESGEWQQDPQAAYSFALKTFGPGEGERQAEGLFRFAKLAGGQVKTPEEALDTARKVATALNGLDDATVAQMWPTLGQAFGSVGMDIGEAYDPQQHRPIIRQLAVAEKKARKFEKVGDALLEIPEEGAPTVAYEAPQKPREPKVVGGALVDIDPTTGQARELYRAPERPDKPDKPQVMMTPDGPMLLDVATGTARPVLGPTGEPVPGKARDIEVKPLSAEGSQRMAYSTTAIALAKELEKTLADPGAYRAGYAGLDTDIVRKVDDLIDASIRARTGAAANAQEMKERRGQVWRALDAARGNTKSAVAAIQRIGNEMRTLQEGIDPTGTYRKASAPAAEPNAVEALRQKYDY